MITYEEDGRVIVLLEDDDLAPEEEVDTLGGEYLTHNDYDFLVSGVSTDVYKPDGEPLLFYRPDVLDPAVCKQAFDVLSKLRTAPTNRGMASGKAAGNAAVGLPAHVSGYAMRQDGTPSGTLEALATIGDRPYMVRSGEHYFVLQQGRLLEVDGKPFDPNAGVYMNGRPFNADGRLSNTVRMQDKTIAKAGSDIIGSFDRYSRNPYCRLTAFNLKDKSPMLQALPFLQAVDAVFRGTLPDRYENQRVWVERTEQDWVVPGTAFSTVTVNNNYRTACHKDAGDLKEGFGVMAVLQAGEYSGGYLVFPRFRVAVDMRTLGVCCADVHEWHGNTPFVGKQGKYHRTSCVFYYRANMYKCGTHEHELKVAQNRKPGDPIWKDSREAYWEEKGVATDVDASDGAVVYTGKEQKVEA